jgi:hypothetical protein
MNLQKNLDFMTRNLQFQHENIDEHSTAVQRDTTHIFGTFLSKFLFGAFHLLFFGNKLTISIAIADAPDRADHALKKNEKRIDGFLHTRSHSLTLSLTN